MKLNGQSFDGPNLATLVLPRNGNDLVFKAQAVLDYTEFETLCPTPKPKTVHKPGEGSVVLWDDKSYKDAMDSWGAKKTAYTILKSLTATPGLEWETVKMELPETWTLYREELKKAFFSEAEQVKIIGLVWEANGLDQSKLDEAQKRFLATQVAGLGT